MRYLLTAIFSASLFLVGCSSNSTASKNNQNGNLSVSCSAVAGTVSGSTVPLSISAFGGTAPYVVTGLSISGTSVTSVSGSTTFSGSTQLSAIFAGVANLANAVGTVTVMDAGNPSSSASCSFMTGGGGTNPNPTNKCTVVASNSSPAVNQDVTLTFNSASGFGVGPYTFSNLQAGSNVTVVSQLQTVSSNQAVATVRYSAGGSQTISGTITDITGQSGTCSTSITVSGGTSGVTCSMAGTVNGMNISWQVSSPSGSASINSFSPGDQGTYSYLSNPITATYSAAGMKNAVALAYVNGQPCNGNGYVYGSATVNQASNMTCQLIINPNPSRAGYWVSVQVIVQGGVSPSLREITFPTGYGIGGQYTGPLTAQMVFVYPGQFPVYAKVADVYGTQATCQTLQTVSY